MPKCISVVDERKNMGELNLKQSVASKVWNTRRTGSFEILTSF